MIFSLMCNMIKYKIMKNIAIFASGSGTNAQMLMEHFSNKQHAKITMILSNNADAFVLERAARMSIPSFVFDRKDFSASDKTLNLLIENNIDFIILAGFLWLIPPNIIARFPNKIVNIHPALLPKYGGKGMYGDRVHNVVIENGEKESGITIHYVNEEYDEGNIIFQAKCDVKDNDTASTLADRIHKLEHLHYPLVVENILQGS